jgi:hypothetical protein
MPQRPCRDISALAVIGPHANETLDLNVESFGEFVHCAHLVHSIYLVFIEESFIANSFRRTIVIYLMVLHKNFDTGLAQRTHNQTPNKGLKVLEILSRSAPTSLEAADNRRNVAE